MGVVVNYGEREQLRAALLDYYEQYKAGKINVAIDDQFIHKFERRELTKQLVSLLEKL